MRPESATGFADDLGALVSGESKVLEPEADHQVFAQPTLTLPHRARDELDHAEIALDRSGVLGVEAVGSHPRDHEIAENGQANTGLPQRRQDLLDVGEEEPVRPDDENTLVLQREAMGVEQVGGPVQRHDRLAGPRATLHDQHARLWRTDDLVLFALNRRHDVAQPACAGGLECGDQRAVALDAAVCGLCIEAIEVAEELVVDVEELSTASGEVASSLESERVGAGCPVEGFGGACSPVDDHRVLRSIPYAHASDVERVAVSVVVVDASEHQRCVADVELGEPVDDVLRERLSLEARLVGAAGTDLEVLRKLARQLARLFDARMGVVEVLLFGCKIGVNDGSPRVVDEPKGRFGGLSIIAVERARPAALKGA